MSVPPIRFFESPLYVSETDAQSDSSSVVASTCRCACKWMTSWCNPRADSNSNSWINSSAFLNYGSVRNVLRYIPPDQPRYYIPYPVSMSRFGWVATPQPIFNINGNVWANPEDEHLVRIREHEALLPKDATAIGFFDRAIEQHLQTLKTPIQDIDQRISILQNDFSAEGQSQLVSARLERTEALRELRNQVDNFSSFLPEDYLKILIQVVKQAVMSEKPLTENNQPTNELPLALHSECIPLETLRKNNKLPGTNATILDLGSRIQQGHPTCKAALEIAWKKFLETEQFKACKDYT